MSDDTIVLFTDNNPSDASVLTDGSSQVLP